MLPRNELNQRISEYNVNILCCFYNLGNMNSDPKPKEMRTSPGTQIHSTAPKKFLKKLI